MIKSVFNAYSKYYDLLYLDKDYIGEAKYVEKQLKNNGINKGDILEFGSGTGKHGRLLAERGYKVHGIELSSEMVDLAEITEGFSCQQGNICNISMERKFNAVISLFHVVSYQVSNDELESVFFNAASHLDSDGIFVFDFWYSPAVYNNIPSVRIKKMSDNTVDITRIAEPKMYFNENRVDVEYTIFARDKNSGEFDRFSESHSIRHLSLPEIDIFANKTGFKRICSEEFLTGKKPGPDTWGVCVVLKKI